MTRPQQRTVSAPPLLPAPPYPNGDGGPPSARHDEPGPNRYRTLLGAARQRADRAARVRRRRRTVTRRLIWVAVLLLTAAIAIGVALRITPQQTVSVAGQVIKVGTTTPSLSVSGPGEVNLFGQSLPTQVQFLGPVRPSLTLTQITINSQLTNFVQGAGPGGGRTHPGRHPGQRLDPLLPWEIATHRGGGAAPARGAGGLAAAAAPDHRESCWPAAWSLTEVINLGAIMLTAYTAPCTLRQVRSLSQLVGSERAVPGRQEGPCRCHPGSGWW